MSDAAERLERKTLHLSASGDSHSSHTGAPVDLVSRYGTKEIQQDGC